MTDTRSALQKAIDAKGGQLPLAKAIGTSQSNVWEWLNKSRRGVPAEWVIAIEQATGVPRHELRPDLYPPSDPLPAEPNPAPNSPAPAAVDAA